MLYLIKWDDGTSALVTANDEDELAVVLDQLADPFAASWEEYDGPLWLEFPRIEEGLPAGDVDPDSLRERRPQLPDTDHAEEFVERWMAAVQPELSMLRDAAFMENRAIPRAAFDEAVAADLGWALPGSLMQPPAGPDN